MKDCQINGRVSCNNRSNFRAHIDLFCDYLGAVDIAVNGNGNRLLKAGSEEHFYVFSSFFNKAPLE